MDTYGGVVDPVASFTANRKVHEYAFQLGVLISVLNINGVLSMAIGVNQAASAILGICVVVLALRDGISKIQPGFWVLAASILAYLIVGSVGLEETSGDETEVFQYIVAYGLSLPLMFVLCQHLVHGGKSEFDARMRFVRSAFVAASLSVYVSPVLYGLYVNLPSSFDHRMGGFFANPNEAGSVSVIALALILNWPLKNWGRQCLAIALVLGATVLTLSKTAISGYLVVLALWLLLGVTTSTITRAIYFVLLAVGVGAVIFHFDFEMIIKNLPFEPDLALIRRLESVQQLVEMNDASAVTTGRTVLWEIAAERGLDSLPWGEGLGAAHHMVGGVYESGEWQGSHNTFLMFFVESGFLAPTLLILAVIALLRDGMRSKYAGASMVLFVPVILDLCATHSALSARFICVAFAVLAALASRNANPELSAGPVSAQV